MPSGRAPLPATSGIARQPGARRRQPSPRSSASPGTARQRLPGGQHGSRGPVMANRALHQREGRGGRLGRGRRRPPARAFGAHATDREKIERESDRIFPKRLASALYRSEPCGKVLSPYASGSSAHAQGHWRRFCAGSSRSVAATDVRSSKGNGIVPDPRPTEAAGFVNPDPQIAGIGDTWLVTGATLPV